MHNILCHFMIPFIFVSLFFGIAGSSIINNGDFEVDGDLGPWNISESCHAIHLMKADEYPFNNGAQHVALQGYCSLEQDIPAGKINDLCITSKDEIVGLDLGIILLSFQARSRPPDSHGHYPLSTLLISMKTSYTSNTSNAEAIIYSSVLLNSTLTAEWTHYQIGISCDELSYISLLQQSSLLDQTKMVLAFKNINPVDGEELSAYYAVELDDISLNEVLPSGVLHAMYICDCSL